MTLRDRIEASLGDVYDIESELGGGGMARVFAARDRRLDRRVVIKTLAPEVAASLDADRFQRKIRLAASLQQANIVPSFRPAEVYGVPYYTMPFVEGESLRERLGAQGAFPVRESVGHVRDVARALVSSVNELTAIGTALGTPAYMIADSCLSPRGVPPWRRRDRPAAPTTGSRPAPSS